MSLYVPVGTHCMATCLPKKLLPPIAVKKESRYGGFCLEQPENVITFYSYNFGYDFCLLPYTFSRGTSCPDGELYTGRGPEHFKLIGSIYYEDFAKIFVKIGYLSVCGGFFYVYGVCNNLDENLEKIKNILGG